MLYTSFQLLHAQKVFKSTLRLWFSKAGTLRLRHPVQGEILVNTPVSCLVCPAFDTVVQFVLPCHSADKVPVLFLCQDSTVFWYILFTGWRVSECMYVY